MHESASVRSCLDNDHHTTAPCGLFHTHAVAALLAVLSGNDTAAASRLSGALATLAQSGSSRQRL